MWTSIFVVCQVVVAIFMVAFVLLQRGQGATAGAGLGGGGGGAGGVSSTVFGARGAGNFLSRTTALLAIGFFGISLGLAAIEADRAQEASQGPGLGVMEQDSAEPVGQPGEVPVSIDSAQDSASSVPQIDAEAGSETEPATEVPAAEPAEAATEEEGSGAS